MTRDDVLRLSKQAHIYTDNEFGSAIVGTHQLERFASLVAAHEREECAKACKTQANVSDGDIDYRDGCFDCALAIRQRGSAD